MWLTDLLRKITQGPDVGETFRNYIGCYFYGSQVHGSLAPHYVGAPTSLAALHDGVQQLLEDFLSTQQDKQTPHALAAQATLDQLGARLAAHTQGDMQQPFLQLNGADLFIRKGMRERRKVQGQFTE